MALCSFMAYCVLPIDFAPYVVMPGVFVGVLTASILAAMTLGNAHGANWIVVGIVASVVNFPCYVGISYAILSFWFRNSGKGARGN